MVQSHIFYSGTVQGVGFRFTTQRLANELNLTGWVRNLSDGRVEILAEGSKEKTQELIDQLDKYFASDIESREIDFISRQDGFRDFSIYPTY